MPEHDVMIVGAGPVGMLLGCLLAGRGLDVMVCESRHGLDERTRAIGVHPPGLAALDAAGVGREIRREGMRLERGEVHARGRMLASVPFGRRRSILTIPQRRTDAVLRGRLRTLGAPVRGGCEILSATQDEQHVTVRMHSGGADREATASFLVCADGVRSVMRRQLGTAWLPQPGTGRYSMLDMPDPDDDPVARLFCEPTGLVESFPLPGGDRRWVVRHTDDSSEMDAERFAHEIAERTGVVIRMPADAEPTAFTAAQHRAERSVHGRIVLLGDAAHELSPIGGQGMNLGWIDAHRLADALGRSLSRSAPDLAGYERGARRRAAAAQRRSAFYMSMGDPASRTAQRKREAVIRVLGSRPLHRASAFLISMGGV